MRVERRERLVEHEELRLADQDARERRALLLTAGELGGLVLFQALESHHAQDLAQLLFTLHPIPLAMQAAKDVLPHGHVGKQRVILEEVAHVPLLRREVDLLFRVEEHDAVELDMPAVGLFDAGDALERVALAAARGAEQAGDARVGLKSRVELKNAERFVDVNDQTHAFTAFFCRVSSRFTVSSTTVLMARLTSTQNMAPRSSLVRQSW